MIERSCLQCGEAYQIATKCWNYAERFRKENPDSKSYCYCSKLCASKARYSKIDISGLLVENSTVFLTGKMKKIIIQNELLEYSCQECGITNSYNNKKLILQIDHINGNNRDHRLENLQFLCPNCHSQTETYCNKYNVKSEQKTAVEAKREERKAQRAKNKLERNKRVSKRKAKKAEIQARVKELGLEHGHQLPKPHTRKVKRPSKEELQKLVWQLPSTEIAKQFGVSDRLIGKWCEYNKIEKPGRGYWTKINADKK